MSKGYASGFYCNDGPKHEGIKTMPNEQKHSGERKTWAQEVFDAECNAILSAMAHCTTYPPVGNRVVLEHRFCEGIPESEFTAEKSLKAMYSELIELRAQNAQLQSDKDHWEKLATGIAAECSELKTRLKELEKFIKHDANCTHATVPILKCICGLDALLNPSQAPAK